MRARIEDGVLRRAARAYSHSNPRSPRKTAHSNTGIVGIYETIKWVRYFPRRCFRVQLRSKGHQELPVSKCIYYGRKRSRGEALRIALGLRKMVWG